MAEDDEPWRNLGFEEAPAAFESASQTAKARSEGWVAGRLFRPNCGAERLQQHPANKPVADFLCTTCGEDYELKAGKSRPRKPLRGSGCQEWGARSPTAPIAPCWSG